MKRVEWMAIHAIVFGLLLGGCGSDDGGTAPAPVAGGGDTAPVDANVSGTWRLATASGDEDSGTLNLTQDGTVVRGTFGTASGYNGTVAGSVEGTNMTVTLTYSTGPSTLSANIAGSSMSGTYEAVSGQSGTFSGTK